MFASNTTKKPPENVRTYLMSMMSFVGTPLLQLATSSVRSQEDLDKTFHPQTVLLVVVVLVVVLVVLVLLQQQLLLLLLI